MRKKIIQPRKFKAKKIKWSKKETISHLTKPSDLSVEEWQAILRKQIATQQKFKITHAGNTRSVFSDYKVFNPTSKNTYKVAIRSKDNTLNYCSCYDFKTNQLGTCKHIEAVLATINKKPALRRILHEKYEPAYSSIFLSYRGERKVKVRIGTDKQEKFIRFFKEYFDKENCLNENGFAKIEELLRKAASIDHSFRCYADAMDYIISYREKKKRDLFMKKYSGGILPEIKDFSAKLFPYQKEGIRFCIEAGRTILADDMGLGKTIQAIGYSELMRQYFGVEKIYIVCPTSLKYQWKSEIEKFTKSSVTVVEGNLLSRMRIYSDDGSLYKIVTYNVITNDWAYINAQQPDLIILDEAQRIKNWKTKISQHVKKLQSNYALVLTGTPLENNLEELYSLVQFVNPFLLGSLYNFLSKHQVKDERGKVIGYQDLHEVSKVLTGSLLRRTKKKVLQQLPERRDKNLFVTMTQQQRELHGEYADHVAKLVSKWKKWGFLTEKERKSLMINLNMMRMVCDSTYIIDQETNYQTKIDEVMNILEEIFIIEGEKVVIFSQWERMTRLVAKELDKRKVKFEYLHGGVPAIKRRDLYFNFTNDPECRIFLSTDAGGVGLNLQAAANMINLDIPWNPAVLEQRIGRIYRLGQKKNVSITNLVSQDTIEERMLEVLKFKSALAEGILDNGENNIFMGESKFKKFMRSVEEITGTLKPVEAREEVFEEMKEVTSEKSSAPSPEQIGMFKDDDIATTKDAMPAPEVAESKPAGDSDLIETGLSFMSQLLKTLSDKDATETLARNLTEKDSKTGKTYLKIPVESESTITNAITLLSGLFKALK
ncbi:MAG: DEAD/DEAH box helicase [Chitinophagales bacterium]